MDAVLIHGFLGDGRVWDPMLDAGLPFDRVITVELVGDDAVLDDGDEWQITDVAVAIGDQLDELGIDAAAWIGHSLGGYVVAAAVATIPERVAAAVLAYSTPSPDSDTVKQRRDAEIDAVQRDGADAFVASKVPVLFMPDDPADTIDAYGTQAATWTAHDITVALAAIRDRPDTTDALLTCGVPTLIIRGADDVVVAYSDLDAPHITETITPGGHMAPLTAPDLVTDAISTWVDALGEPGATGG